MKITVAIPTINGRSKYLEASLRTCVTQDQDFEILVSDNPGGVAREVAASFSDPRIRYITPPKYLPMSAHWDFVLSEVTGHFLTIIGDDDGLMPGCIKRIQDIQSQVGDIPIHHALAHYCWPDFDEESKRNTLFIEHPVGGGQREVQSSAFLKSIAKAKGRYIDGPMIYHNFAPTALLRSLTVNGTFFRRAAPDVYSAMAIAANSEIYVSTNELLTISGQGARSNGAEIRSGKDNGFFSEANLLYPSRFKSVSAQMFLLDSYLEVAEHFKMPNLMLDIDYKAHFSKVYRELQAMGRELREEELRFLSGKISKFWVYFKYLQQSGNRVRRYSQRASQPFRIAPSKIAFQVGNVEMPPTLNDIFDVTRYLSAELNKDPFNQSPADMQAEINTRKSLPDR
jgi:glycosyltransferase involved in cell wall biosynthesis